MIYYWPIAADITKHEDVYGVLARSSPLPFLHQSSKIHAVIYNADVAIIIKSVSDPDTLISSLERELINVCQWK